MTSVLPLWLEILKAVAPLLAALLAAGVGAWVAHKFGRIQESIARQQADTAAAAAKTARNKLKLDLFDRRLKVYQAALDAISIALQKGDFTATDEHAFLLGIHGARWIFDEKVSKYLKEELWNNLTDLHMAEENLKDLPIGESRKELAEARHLAFKKVREHLNKIDDFFANALQLED